jgi:MFS transporter, DHA1 family, inner membrane transport protein
MSAPDRQTSLMILSLALGAFAIGVSEFAAMGLLPYYAADLGVSDPAAGHAVSSYAIGVVIGAPVLAVIGAGLRRKTMLMLLMGGFAAGNLLCALSPGITTLVSARLLAGLPHATYLGIAMLFAARLQPEGKGGQGIAQVMLGLTVANIIGVPAAGWMGQTFGWRTCFFAVAVLSTLSVAMIARFASEDGREPSGSPLKELGAFANRAVWLTLLVAAVGFGGVFAVYAYLSAAMIDATDAPSWSIPLALSAFGIGATIGNFVAERLAAWSRIGGAFVLLSGMTLAPLLYAAVMGNWVLMSLAILLLGVTAGVFIPLQMRLMEVAGEAQTLASAMNHGAFNLANAIGPFLSGLALAAGFGWASTGFVGAALAAAGIGALGLAWLDASKRAGPPEGFEQLAANR